MSIFDDVCKSIGKVTQNFSSHITVSDGDMEALKKHCNALNEAMDAFEGQLVRVDVTDEYMVRIVIESCGISFAMSETDVLEAFQSAYSVKFTAQDCPDPDESYFHMEISFPLMLSKPAGL